MSEEVIKVLDALAEKFGLAIDWTSANVLPYLQQLCGKYVRYEIVTSIIWVLIGICLLLVGKQIAEKSKKYWKEYKKNMRSDYDCASIVLGVIAGFIIISGIVLVLSQVFDIVTCITFPEKIIIDEIKSIYLNLQ